MLCQPLQGRCIRAADTANPPEEDDVARVQVLADDGFVTLAERVSLAELDQEHFRNCLAERIQWAAADAAEREETQPGDDGSAN